MEKEIDGMLVAVWTTYTNALGQEVRSLRPTDYEIETADGMVTMAELFESFYDPDEAMFVVVKIQREDVDGNPV